MVDQRIASETEDQWIRRWTCQHSELTRQWRAHRHLPLAATDGESGPPGVGDHQQLVAAHDRVLEPSIDALWMRSLREDLASLPVAFDGIVPAQLEVIDCATGTVPMYLPQPSALYVPWTVSNLLPLPLLSTEATTFTQLPWASSAWVLLDALCLHPDGSTPLFLEDAHFICHDVTP